MENKGDFFLRQVLACFLFFLFISVNSKIRLIRRIFAVRRPSNYRGFTVYWHWSNLIGQSEVHEERSTVVDFWTDWRMHSVVLAVCWGLWGSHFLYCRNCMGFPHEPWQWNSLKLRGSIVWNWYSTWLHNMLASCSWCQVQTLFYVYEHFLGH